MNKKAGIGIVILIMIIIAGLCIGTYFLFFSSSDNLPSNFNSLSEKEQIRIIHERNARYYLDGETEKFVDAHAETMWTEKGLTKEQIIGEFEKEFNEPDFQEYRGKKLSEVFDLSETTIWERDEEIKVDENTNYICCGKDGDYQIIFWMWDKTVQPEPIFGMIYKKINGEWKINQWVG